MGIPDGSISWLLRTSNSATTNTDVQVSLAVLAQQSPWVVSVRELFCYCCLFVLRQVFTVYPWLTWNSLCRWAGFELKEIHVFASQLLGLKWTPSCLDSFSFWRNLLISFHSDYTNLHAWQQWIRDPLPQPCILINLCLLHACRVDCRVQRDADGSVVCSVLSMELWAILWLSPCVCSHSHLVVQSLDTEV